MTGDSEIQILQDILNSARKTSFLWGVHFSVQGQFVAATP